MLPTGQIDLSLFLTDVRQRVDCRLDELVPGESVDPKRLHSAIRWSLLGGGKRLRPALVFAVGRTLGAADDNLLDTACAFEMLHTYSLIHDDLPSMDDDDLRRGRNTCHVEFDEATAILAGDALQAMAFQTIAFCTGVSNEVRLELIRELTTAAGTPVGMVAGQSLDLGAETRSDTTAEELRTIHQRKTGALITAAARSGALIAGAAEEELMAITEYASNLGLLFQITDDLLDVTATAEDLGKTPGKDARTQKVTYPSLYGLDGARLFASQTCKSAVGAIEAMSCDTLLLTQLAEATLARRS